MPAVFSRVRAGPGQTSFGVNAPSFAGAPQSQFSEDPNAIVTVQVSTQQAPTPNEYQRFGALVSFGGTNLDPQSAEELTQAADLSNFTQSSIPITSAQWAAGVVTMQSSVNLPDQYAPGNTANFSVTGFVPTAYNYSGQVQIVDAQTFTFPLSSDPGSVTTMGTWQAKESVELQQMVNTFFDQGNAVSVWVLELGYSGVAATDAVALQTWLTQNPRSFYGYLMPRAAGSLVADLQAFQPVFQQYQSPESMTYFWLTVTPATMATLGTVFKNVIQLVEAPSVTDPASLANPSSEFTCAAMFYNAIAFKPSQNNRVAPMAFKYLYGVTAYPTHNNGPLLISFKANNTNYVATGAEGGISYNMVYSGVTKDGYDYFNWWWVIDYVQIQANIDVTNAIINGSNNPLAPLYFDQPGIDFLLSTLYGTMNNAATFGMVVGKLMMTELNQPDLQNAIQIGTFAGACNVNGVPFIDYTNSHPGDFKIGEYDGLSVLFIPARGFIHVLITIVASSLVTV